VREAARLRLACLVTPALQGLHDIIRDKKHPQRLAAIKEVLERNDLHAFGVEPKAAFSPAHEVNVNTQVNVLPEVYLASMSDQDLETYRKLLEELRELLPQDEPKRIGSVSR
jgi:hypothetical protein